MSQIIILFTFHLVLREKCSKAIVLFSSWDNTVNIMEPNKKLITLTGHTDVVSQVKFDNDPNQFQSASFDGTVLLWDYKSQTISQKFQGHSRPINSMDVASDNVHFASASDDHNVIIWNKFLGMTTKVLYGHKRAVNSVKFHPFDNLLLTGANDKTAILWDFDGNIRNVFNRHIAPVSSVTFSANGLIGFTGAEDGTILMWSLSTQMAIKSMEFHKTPITSLLINGYNLYSSSEDGIVHRTKWLEDTTEILFQENGTITQLDIDKKSNQFAQSAWNGNVTLQKMNSNKSPFMINQGNAVTSISVICNNYGTNIMNF